MNEMITIISAVNAWYNIFTDIALLGAEQFDIFLYIFHEGEHKKMANILDIAI